jgi:hypothetical protein
MAAAVGRREQVPPHGILEDDHLLQHPTEPAAAPAAQNAVNGPEAAEAAEGNNAADMKNRGQGQA